MMTNKKPLLAVLAIGLSGMVACSERDPVTNAFDEPANNQGSGLSADKLPAELELEGLRTKGYDSCTGQSFPPFFDDLIDASFIPDFTIQQFGDRGIAASLPPASALQPKGQGEKVGLLNVIGSKSAPLLLANSDVLVKSKRIKQSPGPEFASSRMLFDKKELAKLEEHQTLLKKNGDLAKQGLIFEGRNPLATSASHETAVSAVIDGKLVAASLAPLMPTSTEGNWLESLLINAPEVVQDPDRTFEPCTEAGNPDGVWTFKHLMTEMANQPLTGITPEDFTLEFLLTWLFPRTINGDLVADRGAMWTKVIEPWLDASGGFQLDLDRAPFRLLAIVNRLDLRKTTTGGGYFGSSGIPLDAGELRFVFGVVDPNEKGDCEALPFTVIFEYGVPISGCFGVRDWAREWTKLNIFPSFGTAYRNQLATLTEQVVVRDAAPAKGNGNAINQIRTNEIALAGPWEMNEFTLTDETNGNVPVNGWLQLHTVAQTPDDGVYSPTPNPVVSDFIDSIVPPPGQCATNHTVPLEFQNQPFRGGNSLVGQTPGSPPGTWFGDAPAVVTNEYICGRHQFSVNTCNGCHSCDTGTTFTHISPTSGIPAALSGFLTGVAVKDTQFPGVKTWTFADLDRRFVDLYQVADSMCLIRPPVEILIAELIRDRFPDPVFDPAEAIEILDRVEREAIDRLPAGAQPNPDTAVLLSDIGRHDLTAAH